ERGEGTRARAGGTRTNAARARRAGPRLVMDEAPAAARLVELLSLEEQRGLVVRREEGLDRELGERDVDGGAERRCGADEGELRVAGADAQRHGDLAGLEVHRVPAATTRVAGQLIV